MENLNKLLFALEKTSGVGFKTISEVVKDVKTTEEFVERKTGLSKYRSIVENIKLDEFDNYKKVLKNMEVELMNVESDDYPKRLLEVPERPLWLHTRGNVGLLANKTVAIVGSRKSTKYGNEVAYKIGKMLSEQGYTIVSGLADGIDSHAHKGALEGGGSTIAVVGSGLDVIYPKTNTKLYFDIVKKGLVVSEYIMGVKPQSFNFPRRNRIISGLADFVIVVEASFKSGSMITVNHAFTQGKDVLAVPGEIFSENSEGTNLLIRDGAYPLISLEDLSEYLDNL